jgi:hypothetical protein
MAGSDINADLEIAVASGPLRGLIDRFGAELELAAQKEAPPARIWRTVGDERVRETHRQADGQAIPTNLKFILNKPERGPTARGQAERAAHHAEGHGGGSSGDILAKPESYGMESARYPRDETLSPGNRYNCRCHDETDTEMIARTVHADPSTVQGTRVSVTVSTRFPRAAESEFGDGDGSPGLRWMGRALNETSAKLAGSP